MNNYLGTLLLALALGAATALAQEAEPEEEQQESQAEESAPVETERNTRDIDAVSDYEASEQISEDLSVSFPVDI